jgi:hypothetical protein
MTDYSHAEIRSMPFDKKVEVLRELCTNYRNDNIYTAVGVFSLVLAPTLDEEWFKNDNVWFVSLEEYLDVRQALSTEIDKLAYDIGCLFLGCLKGNVGITVIPEPLAQNILLASNFTLLRKLIRRLNVQFADVPGIQNAELFWSQWILQEKLVSSLREKLLNDEQEDPSS